MFEINHSQRSHIIPPLPQIFQWKLGVLTPLSAALLHHKTQQQEILIYHKVIHLIKTNQFYNENSSRNKWISKGWQVYPIWKQQIHICLWVWCPLNSGVLRLKHQSHISALHHFTTAGDPGDFRHLSWCPLRELHSPAWPDLLFGGSTQKCVPNC